MREVLVESGLDFKPMRIIHLSKVLHVRNLQQEQLFQNLVVKGKYELGDQFLIDTISEWHNREGIRIQLEHPLF